MKDNFFYDDMNKKNVVMGNKKKEVDVKELMQQNEAERKKRQLHKLQMDSATVMQKEIKRFRAKKQIASQLLGTKEEAKQVIEAIGFK